VVTELVDGDVEGDKVSGNVGVADGIGDSVVGASVAVGEGGKVGDASTTENNQTDTH
jgi:hypothetical protein